MNTVWIVLAFVCLAVGVAGSVVPGLPGPPLSWAGLGLAAVSHLVTVSPQLLVATAVVAVVITVLDYVVPSLSTKRFGGSKYGVWGCNIGLVVSLFGLPFGPQGVLGVVLWPFIGALAGEYLHQRQLHPALRAAFGAFVGFLSGTLMKAAYCVGLLVLVVVRLF